MERRPILQKRRDQVMNLCEMLFSTCLQREPELAYLSARQAII